MLYSGCYTTEKACDRIKYSDLAMDIQTAFRVKWLGSETSEICNLLAAYQPLIHVWPAPALTEAPPGMMALPSAVSLRWDLQAGNPIVAGDDAPEFHIEYETINSTGNSNIMATIYDFYFEVYIKHTAFEMLQGTRLYNDIDMLHENLMEQRYFSFTRAFIGGKVVGACLIKVLPAYLNRMVAVIDFICSDVRFKSASLTRRILSKVAEQARKTGFDYLQTQQMSPVTAVYDAYDLSWALGGPLATVAHLGPGSFLYCDLERCSYFPNDFFFYRRDEDSTSLHYVANVSPDTSLLESLMRSVVNVEKKIYTRLSGAQKLAADLNVECIFLRG